MQLRWSEEAAADLERVSDYLFKYTPSRAGELVATLYSAPDVLLRFPHRGRPGRVPGTRELVLTPLPYLIVYCVREDGHNTTVQRSNDYRDVIIVSHT